MKRNIVSSFSLAVALGLAVIAHAENGITDTEILLGQTAVFDGPASALGQGMRAGLESCFNEVNATGGAMGG